MKKKGFLFVVTLLSVVACNVPADKTKPCQVFDTVWVQKPEPVHGFYVVEDQDTQIIVSRPCK